MIWSLVWSVLVVYLEFDICHNHTSCYLILYRNRGDGGHPVLEKGLRFLAVDDSVGLVRSAVARESSARSH
jgi:hypothetical protein